MGNVNCAATWGVLNSFKAGLTGKCALTDAKSDMLIETMNDVKLKCWMGSFGSVAQQFPTHPGTARLVENTQGGVRFCSILTLFRKPRQTRGGLQQDFQKDDGRRMRIFR